jgi:hypothetical protein
MDGTTITVTLELRVEGDSLTGRASDGAGSVRSFAGWLGLVAAIDALVPPHDSTSSESEDTKCDL